MRLVILALALSACTPPSWERAKQRSPRQGVPIAMFCTKDNECSAKQRGTVSVRGGDQFDYYAVTLPRTTCNDSLNVELRWTVPRQGSQLALSVWSPDGRRAMKRSRRHIEGGTATKLALEASVDAGTYFVGVHAMDFIGAGEYTLNIVESSRPCGGRWTPSGWQPIGDVYLPRPENLAPPRSSDRLVAITSAGMSRNAQGEIEANEPTFVIDASDAQLAPGSHGFLVDRDGKRVAHSEFYVADVWSPESGRGDVRFASARFVEPGWFRRPIETGWNYWFATLDANHRQ
jgi:hypothetical protein